MEGDEYMIFFMFFFSSFFLIIYLGLYSNACFQFELLRIALENETAPFVFKVIESWFSLNQESKCF